tara:strand:+ start:330 stop:557 length:228 start_codon:yes stop_codon:yes gene_type:complete
MARKLLATRTTDQGSIVCKIYRDAGWQEFVVQQYLDGRNVGAYYTGDYADAVGTADAFARHATAQENLNGKAGKQ